MPQIDDDDQLAMAPERPSILIVSDFV